MRTFVASARGADSRWHVIDAQDKVLGRVATLAARLLQGKHKAIYTPFIDTGDHVVVVNAAKVKLTGRKDDQKIYDFNYQATKEAIERAMTGKPSVADVISGARTAKHPFASNAEDKRGSKQMAGTNV